MLPADANFLLYLSKTSSLSDNMMRINSGATPAYSQAKITANAAGAISHLVYSVDNSVMGFDVDYVSPNFIARHTAIAQIYKQSSKLQVVGSTGNSSGSTATTITMWEWDLATGNVDKILGKFTQYNNIATVSNGVPSELATVDLTTQAAAISATALYTPAVSGMFRISVVLQVTRAATTSSILGGTTGVVLTYTEPDGSVAQTVTVEMSGQNGNTITTATGNTGNSTTTQSKGDADIYAKTGVAINYAVGYTSVGGTTMQFSVHIKLEAL